MARSRRAKALDIDQPTKDRVFLRDGQKCVLCGTTWTAMPNAHYISRAQGGLGVEQNVVTLCHSCHDRYDNSVERLTLRERIRAYLEAKYPNWAEVDLTYKKW
jgi:5-methylcytosine-specific restriction endonuclease McrA